MFPDVNVLNIRCVFIMDLDNEMLVLAGVVTNQCLLYFKAILSQIIKCLIFLWIYYYEETNIYTFIPQFIYLHIYICIIPWSSYAPKIHLTHGVRL